MLAFYIKSRPVPATAEPRPAGKGAPVLPGSGRLGDFDFELIFNSQGSARSEPTQLHIGSVAILDIGVRSVRPQVGCPQVAALLENPNGVGICLNSFSYIDIN